MRLSPRRRARIGTLEALQSHDDLDRFYELLDQLAARVGGARLLRDCDGRMGWPKRGVYFFFERGEFRRNGRPRVVRVGTHGVAQSVKSTLWGRLRTHRSGNQGSSVFRRHVGSALMNAGRATGAGFESVVGDYIASMPFLWIEADDTPGARSVRASIERSSIALLSRDTGDADEPSAAWLGLWAEARVCGTSTTSGPTTTRRFSRSYAARSA